LPPPPRQSSILSLGGRSFQYRVLPETCMRKYRATACAGILLLSGAYCVAQSIGEVRWSHVCVTNPTSANNCDLDLMVLRCPDPPPPNLPWDQVSCGGVACNYCNATDIRPYCKYVTAPTAHCSIPVGWDQEICGTLYPSQCYWNAAMPTGYKCICARPEEMDYSVGDCLSSDCS
jgi:hypothetical protein